jgi:hypothetical protein
MGMRGPTPKHSSEVLGHRTKAEMAARTATVGRGAARVTIPKAPATWHPIAAQWYASLAQSGQAQWYEPSDWATALFVGEAMDNALCRQMVPAMVSALLKACSDLLATESSRRRLAIELRRGDVDAGTSPAVTVISDYRKAVSG